MKRCFALLVVALPLVLPASLRAGVMIYNLDDSGPSDGGIGKTNLVSAGGGFGLSFLTGAESYQIDSVTLEHYQYDGRSDYFHVQILGFGTQRPGTNQPVLLGELGNAVVDPRPTRWPGYTTFVDYTPDAPIILAPYSYYLLAAVVPAGSPDTEALVFATSIFYTVTPDWQTDGLLVCNWRINQLTELWMRGAGPLKLEINASPVPEPCVMAILAACGLVLAWRRGSGPGTAPEVRALARH